MSRRFNEIERKSALCGKPDCPSCTVSADLMPTAATSGASAIASEVLEAANNPAERSNVCRRDSDFALASCASVVAFIVLGR